MKKRLIVAAILAATAAGADTLTWSGGDGTWDATSLNWNGGTTAWIPGSTAVFADDGCTVTVSGEVDVGGTLEFTGAYPGGELEISSATQGGTAAPLLSAHPFAFASGKTKVRVTGADLLNEQTFGPSKTLVESTSPIAAAPTLELVASDGTPFTDDGKWRVFLSDGGRKLKFGPMRGTQILVK